MLDAIIPQSSINFIALVLWPAKHWLRFLKEATYLGPPLFATLTRPNKSGFMTARKGDKQTNKSYWVFEDFSQKQYFDVWIFICFIYIL